MTDETAIMPATQQALVTDDELSKAIQQAERGIELMRAIRTIAVRLTNAHDWTDLGGKPYLTEDGAIKIGARFGVQETIDKSPTKDVYADGHYMFTFYGVFAWHSHVVDMIGTRSSKDKFFSKAHNVDVPVQDINEGNVKKAAMTNCRGNGIKGVLGLNNYSWEEITSAGIRRDQIARVTYDSGSKETELRLPNYELRDFPGQKGKAVTDMSVPVGSLRGYLVQTERAIADKAKEKYKLRNEALRDAIKAELTRRETPNAEEPKTTATTETATPPQAEISEQTWTDLKLTWMEEHPKTFNHVKSLPQFAKYTDTNKMPWSLKAQFQTEMEKLIALGWGKA